MRCLYLLSVLVCFFVLSTTTLFADEYHNSTVYNGNVYNAPAEGNTPGYLGTWRDPDNGDVVTSVIAPRFRPQEQAPSPIYVYPKIDPTYQGYTEPYFEEQHYLHFQERPHFREHREHHHHDWRR